jgi:DNA-directed RNA polymerase beta subunit
MLTRNEKVAKIKEWLNKTQLDSDVVRRTLNVNEGNVSPTVLLASSKKLIKINKGEMEPDDRDNLRFSKFMGLEDYIEEHIARDAGKVQLKAAQRMQQKKNLSWLSPGFFTPQIRSVIVGNSLANNVDGINPLEHWDNSNRVTKLGPGGIPSIEAVTDESRQVNTSSFGFFDPVHIMETERVGITNFIAHNVIKGRDGKLYRVMKTPDGKLKWMDHEAILDHQVKIPEH